MEISNDKQYTWIYRKDLSVSICEEQRSERHVVNDRCKHHVIRVSARVEVKWSSQESMLTLANTHPLVHVHSLTVLLHI